MCILGIVYLTLQFAKLTETGRERNRKREREQEDGPADCQAAIVAVANKLISLQVCNSI